MTEQADATCVAPTPRCGTPSGWRGGGRCPRCRAAHNRETNRYRATGELTGREREAVLRELSRGATADEAAAKVGRTARSLTRQSAKDSELRVALHGGTLHEQRLARMGDYLAALTRHGGRAADAEEELGLDSVPLWRQAYPDFAKAELHILNLTRPRIRPRGPKPGVDSPQKKRARRRAVELMEQGATARDAARQLGIDTTTLYRWAKQDPGLAAAVAAVRQNQPGLKRVWSQDGHRAVPRQCAVQEKRLRQLWADPLISMAQIGADLGVSRPTVWKWARDLGLPPRRAVSQRVKQEGRLRELWGDPALTTDQIAAELGVGARSVVRWARDLGLPSTRHISSTRAPAGS